MGDGSSLLLLFFLGLWVTKPLIVYLAWYFTTCHVLTGCALTSSAAHLLDTSCI